LRRPFKIGWLSDLVQLSDFFFFGTYGSNFGNLCRLRLSPLIQCYATAFTCCSYNVDIALQSLGGITRQGGIINEYNTVFRHPKNVSVKKNDERNIFSAISHEVNFAE